MDNSNRGRAAEQLTVVIFISENTRLKYKKMTNFCQMISKHWSQKQQNLIFCDDNKSLNNAEKTCDFFDYMIDTKEGKNGSVEPFRCVRKKEKIHGRNITHYFA